MSQGSDKQQWRAVRLSHGEHVEIELGAPGTVRIKMLSHRASVLVTAPAGSEIGRPELERPQSGEE